MLYNLNQDQKRNAKWLVEQFRSGYIPLEFKITFYGKGIEITPWDQDKTYEVSEITRLTIESLHEERLIFVQRPPLNAKSHSVLVCALTERIFTAVDTDFGELETSKPKAPDIIGIGLNKSNYIKLLSEYYSVEELKNLCIQMNIDYEIFHPGGKDTMCRELVLYTQRHGRILELLVTTVQTRCKRDWTIIWD